MSGLAPKRKPRRMRRLRKRHLKIVRTTPPRLRLVTEPPASAS